MKRLLILLTVVLLLAGAVMMASLARQREWTTDSSAALREFELGLEARMKYYQSEALEHFQKAAALDPEFAAAKLYVLFHHRDHRQREELRDELRQVDLEQLTPRERFLLEFNIAQWDRDFDRARELGSTYVAEHPDDPFGLATLADLVWSEQDWNESERLYRELLEVAPNWVTAQNRLGYIALARGRFADAEEQFETYSYIAPDQANPHDSMGELLVLLGRYDEARAEFERALAIRPDFCDAYQHLIDLVLMDGEPAEGEQILTRAAEHCSPRMVESLRCSIVIWDDFITGNAERVWSDEREDCRRQIGEYHFLLHRTAAKTGRVKIAERAERGLGRRIEAAEEAQHVRLDFPRALLLHMEGTRLLTEERFEEAAEAFDAADDLLLYWGEGQGILKLYNRMNLAYALERLGRPEEAARTLEEVRRVNEDFASSYPQSVAM
mgnify:CR=1 FL=1